MTSIEGVTDIKTDIGAKTCTFKTTNENIDTLLAEKAADNAHLKGFSAIQ